MRTVVVDEKYTGKRIDRYIKEAFPNLYFGTLQKAFRQKDIKVNGTRVKQDYIVTGGDRLEIYIVDTALDGVSANGGTASGKSFTVVFEDKNLLIVDKPQGIPVHPDRGQSSDTLIDLVREYCKDTNVGAKDPSFAPSLCHRLDRNTGGLVMIAKNQQTLDIILEKMETREIKKFYQCLVKGRMKKQKDTLKACLYKNEKQSRVYITESRMPGSLEIITKYTALDYYPESDISLLEVELVTGRTHQIRAHMAYIGHPVIGDGKYGTNAVNRPLGAKYQALWAYKIIFDFKNAGILAYLKGRTFQVEPGFQIKPEMIVKP